MKTKTNKKITKKALPTMESELQKCLDGIDRLCYDKKKKEPKKAKDKVKNKYAYHVVWIDNNNKINGELMETNIIIKTPIDVWNLGYSIKEEKRGNYKCLVRWDYIGEIPDGKGLLQHLQEESDKLRGVKCK